MSCERWIEAISAIADGEDPGIDRRLVDAHVARCASCREFRAELDRLRGLGRVRPSLAVPDLSRRIVALNAAADRASRWWGLRALLGAVAISIATLSAPALVLGEEHDLGAHEARHLGAFAVAYAAGLLVVATRPARARTMLPVAVILAAAILITSVVDIAQGRVPFLDETIHLPELASVVLVWLLAVPAARRNAAAARAEAPLRVAGRDDG